uniref:Rho-GAP domain-containing protein n=1 Tax=Macrostomum lignano TaxID=282301 RepID=A0A1I8FFA3_9PLAT
MTSHNLAIVWAPNLCQHPAIGSSTSGIVEAAKRSQHQANMVACLIDNCDELRHWPRLRSHESVRGQHSQEFLLAADDSASQKAGKSARWAKAKSFQAAAKKSNSRSSNRKRPRLQVPSVIRKCNDAAPLTKTPWRRPRLQSRRNRRGPTPRKPWTWLGPSKTVATDTTAQSVVAPAAAAEGTAASPVADEEADYVPKLSVRRAIKT